MYPGSILALGLISPEDPVQARIPGGSCLTVMCTFTHHPTYREVESIRNAQAKRSREAEEKTLHVFVKNAGVG